MIPPILRKFIGKSQLNVIGHNMKGEEGLYFQVLVNKLAKLINEMPKSYDTDGQRDNAVVYLHYFRGGMNWHITEKDINEEQNQAYGYSDLGDGGELGYISIKELIENNVEFDFHWNPITLGKLKNK